MQPANLLAKISIKRLVKLLYQPILSLDYLITLLVVLLAELLIGQLVEILPERLVKSPYQFILSPDYLITLLIASLAELPTDPLEEIRPERLVESPCQLILFSLITPFERLNTIEVTIL